MEDGIFIYLYPEGSLAEQAAFVLDDDGWGNMKAVVHLFPFSLVVKVNSLLRWLSFFPPDDEPP